MNGKKAKRLRVKARRMTTRHGQHYVGRRHQHSSQQGRFSMDAGHFDFIAHAPGTYRRIYQDLKRKGEHAS